MKYAFLLLAMLAFPIFLCSQVFETGYFINEDGERVSCLIKNEGWKYSPTSFRYKLSETDSEQTANIDAVKEFSVERKFKFKKLILDMEKSREQVNSLQFGSAPVLENDTVFLMVLLEGKVDLLKYEDGFIKKFFYSLNSGAIEQLIYIKYLTPNKMISENQTFKKQLKEKLVCSDLTKKDRVKLKFQEASLIRYFDKYNSCHNSDYIFYENKVKTDRFNLHVRPGITLVSLSTEHPTLPARDTEFDKSLGGRLGLELEFILAHTQNRENQFTLFFEPAYNWFSVSTINGGPFYSAYKDEKVTLKYSSIQMPVGIRLYHSINDNSQIFIDGSYTYERDLGSKIFYNDSVEVEFESFGSFNVGAGYRFKKRYVVQVRYMVSKSIVMSISPAGSKYRNGMLVFGYEISGNKFTREKLF